jgi:putative MATE family efflux protein
MNLIQRIFKPIDLTQGTPWKVILAFMMPIFLSLCFQQVYSLTDALIIGQYIPRQFAGVSDTTYLSFVVLSFAFGCTSGFSVITSNKFGQKDQAGVRRSFATSIVLSTAIALLLTAIALLLVPTLLSWIQLSESSDPVTYRAAYVYIMVIYAGMIFQIYYNLICSVLRSIGDSVTPLLFLVFSSLLNIGLDFAFVLLMPTTDLKVAGAAIATILSQGISAALGFIYAFKKYPWLKLHKEDYKMDFSFTKEHLKEGLPLAFQFSILALGLIIMQSSVDAFDVGKSLANGEPAHYAQDGYGANGKLFNFLMMPYDALGTALLSFAAQNDGAGLHQRVKQGTSQSFLMMGVIYGIVNVVGLLLCINGAFVYIFLAPSSIYPETIFYATSYFYLVLPLSFTLGALFIGRNVLQGVGHPLFPFLAGVGELVARYLACLYLPKLVDPANPLSDAGYYAVCSADVLAWSFACAFLIYGVIHFVYHKKKEGRPAGKSL